MGKIILITGGARSGKSQYAQELAEKLGGPLVFVATCPVLDKELELRINRHKESRKARGWKTIEETIDLRAALLRAKGAAAIVVDCLTLWINNVLYQSNENGGDIGEDEVYRLCLGAMETARQARGLVIFVTNEVGMGIVPDNPLARKYRDLLGRCNQVMAREADEVILMVSGLPVRIKSAGEAEPT